VCRLLLCYAYAMEAEHYSYTDTTQWSVMDLLELNGYLKEQEQRLTGERLIHIKQKMAQVTFEIQSRGREHISVLIGNHTTT
jgi:hypothetical protein